MSAVSDTKELFDVVERYVDVLFVIILNMYMMNATGMEGHNCSSSKTNTSIFQLSVHVSTFNFITS